MSRLWWFELVRLRHTKKGSGLARESRQRSAAQRSTAAHGGRSEGGGRKENEKDRGFERKKGLMSKRRCLLPLVRKRYGIWSCQGVDWIVVGSVGGRQQQPGNSGECRLVEVE